MCRVVEMLEIYALGCKVKVCFLLFFLQVCFQPSLPAGGIVKSPALVASNRKALEQIHLSKQNLVFDAENDNLEASLINRHHAGE